MPDEIKITKDTLISGIDDLMPNIKDIVFKIFQYWNTKAVSDMRSNAKWIDRTGNARNGLSSALYDSDNDIVLVMYHSMPYGVWLEIKWSGRYAIIGPTMAEIAPQLAVMISQALVERGNG